MEGWLAALIGLIAGAVGSLAAPWANWGVEKKRLKLAAQRELLAKAREVLAKPPTRENFRRSPEYSRLRPHLSEKTIKEVESNDVTVRVGGSGPAEVNAYYYQVLRDVADIEKRWDLL